MVRDIREIPPVPRTGRKVLVLGEDTRSFLAIVRSLGRQGIEIHAAPIDFSSAALRSRYINRLHRLPQYVNDGTEWLDALERLLAAESFVLVVPCDDRFVLPLHAHRARFCPLAKLAIPAPEAVRTLFDKENTKRLAAEHGVRLAKTAMPQEFATPYELFRALGAPLVVKPRSSYALDTLHSRAKVEIVADAQRLMQVVSGLDPTNYYVEAFFQGSGVGLSVLADDGTIVMAFQHHRIHEAPNGGASAYRISAPISADLLQACERMLGALRYTGVAMFEFRRNFSTGDWILLEVNARPWGSLPLPVALGVDFPAAWYRLMVEGTRPAPTSYRTGIYGRHLILDIDCIRHVIAEATGTRAKLVLALRWLASFRALFIGRERWDTLVADDPRPGLIELRSELRWIFTRIAARMPFVLAAERARVRAAARAVLRGRGPLSIVFVCHGNICRSPFAEKLLAHLLARQDDAIAVSSAGTMPRRDRRCPDKAVAAAGRFGIALSTHRSRYIDDSLMAGASIVFVFEETNAQAVRARFPSLACPVLPLSLLIDKSGDPRKIVDPVDGDDEMFYAVYGLIERAVRVIHREIVQERSLAYE